VPQGDGTLPFAEGSLDDLPDLNQGVTSLSGYIGMVLRVSINVGAEADLGKSP
jgi:hypothetical protein